MYWPIGQPFSIHKFMYIPISETDFRRLKSHVTIDVLSLPCLSLISHFYKGPEVSVRSGPGDFTKGPAEVRSGTGPQIRGPVQAYLPGATTPLRPKGPGPPLLGPDFFYKNLFFLSNITFFSKWESYFCPCYFLHGLNSILWYQNRHTFSLVSFGRKNIYASIYHK